MNITKQQCIELQITHVNPLTRRKLKPDGKTYLDLVRRCKQLYIFENIYNKKESKILLPHQSKVVDYIKDPENKSILLLHNTGSGKTITAIYSIMELLKQKPNNKVIIVVLKSVVIYWEREIEKIFGYIPPNFEFLSYQSVFRDYKLLFNSCPNSIIVIDEIHNLRTIISTETYDMDNIIKYASYNNIKIPNRISDMNKFLIDNDIPEDIWFSAKVGKYVLYNIKCVSKAWKILLLTATPFVNNFLDLNNMFKMLSGKTYNFKTLLDIKNAIISNNLGISYYNVDKNENENYPKTIFKQVVLKLNKEEELEYGEFELDGGDGPGQMIFMNKLRQIGDSGFNNKYYSPKIKYIFDNMKKMKYRKSLIFSSFVGKGTKIAEKVLNVIESRLIDGKSSQYERQQIVNDFNDDKFPLLIISSAGSEGLDLKGVRDVYLLEPGWNFVKEEQSMARAIRYKSHIHLPKNERTVTVHRLILKNTIDEVMQKEYVDTKKESSIEVMDLFQKYSI